MAKKKIVLELDERYFNKRDLSNATYEYLKNENHSCELLDSDTIIVDGNKYLIREWNTSAIVPLQQVVLKLIKE